MEEFVEATLRLDANREMKIRGRITKERNIFGRNEVLLEDIQTEPVWVTREKLSTK